MSASPGEDPPPLGSDELARNRTLMALDRTQMAWIRTALSMLTFGFSVTKFFQFLRQEGAERHTVSEARVLGLAIMSLGLIALTMATWQYLYERHRLRAPRLLHSPAFLLTVFLLVLHGVALFWATVGR